MRIGLEVGPEAVRGVALGGKGDTELIRTAERRVEAPLDLPARAAEVAAELGAADSVHLVLLSGGAQRAWLSFPQIGTSELRQAVDLKANELGDGLPAAWLHGQKITKRPGAGKEASLLCLPREPLESINARLAAQGHVVSGVTTPADLAVTEGQDRAGTSMWADLSGTRTVLTLFDGNQVLVSREIPPRGDADETDDMAQFERQVADFQEIERSCHYARQSENRVVKRLVLCGPLEDMKAFRSQFASPLEELDVEILCQDPREGLCLPPSTEEARLGRFALAIRAARSGGRSLGIIPESTRRARRQQGLRRFGLVAAAVLTTLSVAHAASLRLDRAALETQLLAQQERLAALPEPEHVDGDVPVGFHVEQTPPADWSGLLSEIGLLAGESLSYESVALNNRLLHPKLTVRGVLRTRGSRRDAGPILRELSDGLGASPFLTSLPKMAASAREENRGAAEVAFAFEASVVSAPARRSVP